MGEDAMLGRLGFAALALAAATSGAMSAEATIGDVSINLPTPVGFCELIDREPSDKRLIDYAADRVAKGGNKILGISADCQQLVDWRAGKRKTLDDYAQYHTPISTMKESVPAAGIKETCTVLRAEGNKLVSNTVQDMKTRIEQSPAGIKLNEASFLGVVAEEPSACYAATMMKMTGEIGTKTQVAIIAHTVVKNKWITVYRFALYLNFDSVTNGLAQLTTNVVALLAANQP